jgi:hypothetical protein
MRPTFINGVRWLFRGAVHPKTGDDRHHSALPGFAEAL